jgi:hypothetical protein
MCVAGHQSNTSAGQVPLTSAPGMRRVAPPDASEIIALFLRKIAESHIPYFFLDNNLC